MTSISIYPNAKATLGENADLIKILGGIKNGRWKTEIENYRRIVSKFGKRSPQDRQAKPELPAFTVSGSFSKRSLTGIEQHSGYVAIDIDDLTNENLKKRLCIDTYTFSCFSSAGGAGLCVIVKIIPEQHDEVFKEIEEYYVREYGIEIDYLADVSRLRFVSYDPDLYIYENSKVFELGCETEDEISPNGHAEKIQYWTDEEQIDFAESIVQRDKQFIEGERHKYILSLANLVNKLGVPQSVFESYVNANYPHFRDNPSNAIEWTYRNKTDEFGSWKKEKAIYSNSHQDQHILNKSDKIEENEDYSQEITFSFKPAPRKTLIAINGIRACSPGNLLAIVAKPGTGKSQTSEGVAAAHINPDCDALGFSSHLAANEDFLHIDGERTHDDCRMGFERIAKRIDLENNPDLSDGERMKHYHFWSFIGIPTIKARKEKLEELIKSLNVGLLLLDDITMFISDINDNREANEMMNWLISLANNFNFGIVCTIHPNPADENFKPRGHIGSRVLQKAEAVYLLRRAEDDKEMRRLTTDFPYSKTRSDRDINEVNYAWDSEAGMFMSCDYQNKVQDTTRYIDYSTRFADIFRGQNKNKLRSRDLIDIYMKGYNVSMRTAKAHIKNGCELEVITKINEGHKKVYYEFNSFFDVPF